MFLLGLAAHWTGCPQGTVDMTPVLLKWKRSEVSKKEASPAHVACPWHMGPVRTIEVPDQFCNFARMVSALVDKLGKPRHTKQ